MRKTVNPKLEFLRNLAYLSSFKNSTLTELSFLCEWKVVEPNRIVISPYEGTSDLFIIESGELIVLKRERLETQGKGFFLKRQHHKEQMKEISKLLDNEICGNLSNRYELTIRTGACRCSLLKVPKSFFMMRIKDAEIQSFRNFLEAKHEYYLRRGARNSFIHKNILNMRPMDQENIRKITLLDFMKKKRHETGDNQEKRASKVLQTYKKMKTQQKSYSLKVDRPNINSLKTTMENYKNCFLPQRFSVSFRGNSSFYNILFNHKYL